MTKLDRYAVFGDPINHSKSPVIHHHFAEQTGQKLHYSAQQVSAEQFNTQLNDFFKQGGKGINCTVPLKEIACQAVDHLTHRAQHAKAVNTIIQQTDGSLLGDNTDGVGLVLDLTQNHQVSLKAGNILILGAGGATRGILAPLLAQTPQQIVIANRTPSKAQQLALEFTHTVPIIGCGFSEIPGQEFDLILNATSASLSNQLPPLPDGLLNSHTTCYDLAYSNKATPFVLWSQQFTDKSLDGLGMLIEQAAEAFYLWRGIRPVTRPIIEALANDRL